jgi:hypothetical protein
MPVYRLWLLLAIFDRMAAPTLTTRAASSAGFTTVLDLLLLVTGLYDGATADRT